MIVDQMRAISPGFRNLTRAAHTVRVPFEVCPFTYDPDGTAGIWWQGSNIINQLVPRLPNGAVDCSWWRPPFQDMVIASERREQGVLLVLGRDPKNLKTICDTDLEEIVPEWGAVIALVALDPREEVICVVAHHVYAYRGNLFEPKTGPWAQKLTARVNAALNDQRDNPSYVTNLENVLTELWTHEEQGHSIDVGNMVTCFSTVCALMSCKNVMTEEHRPPEKLQRRRRARGNLPLVSWHVLKVGFRGSRGQPRPGTGRLEPLALHWVRGHFKTFTEERPLLGRAVGTYWWSSHLAGRADRVVLKDYELEGGEW